jgi:phosphate transport system substrate-binding protein
MMNFRISLIVLFVIAMSACNRHAKIVTEEETMVTGKAVFVADESFSPILDQELYVFQSIYSNANLSLVYHPENLAFNLFINDSIRVAILARELSKEEMKILENRKLKPRINRFAIDAVALIVNQNSSDTLITVAEIKKMLNGEIHQNKNIVFDNPNSSIVRYIKTLSGNEKLDQKNIFALKSNDEVIKYVSEHEDAVGIIGFSWLVEPDEHYAEAAKNVKVMAVRDEQSAEYSEEYFKPSQTTLILKQYPLSRNLYIYNSSGKIGLGTGFASFLASERGQRIILKSGLLPDSLPRREINIKNLNSL